MIVVLSETAVCDAAAALCWSELSVLLLLGLIGRPAPLSLLPELTTILARLSWPVATLMGIQTKLYLRRMNHDKG